MNVGAGVEIGYFPEGQESLNGVFTEIEANLFIADVGLVFGEGGKFAGATVELGPQAPGGSVTVGSGGSTNLDPQC